MVEPAKVKGVVLRGVLRDVKELAPGGIPRFMEALPATVRTADFSRNIVHGMWCRYEAFAALLETYLAQVGFGRASAVVDLGRRAAERDLGTLLKIYAAVSSPHRVGSHAAAVWNQRFQNAGAMAFEEKEERSYRLTLSGFRAIHPLNCEFLTGYGAGAGRTWVASYTVVHDRCVHRGQANCSWLSTW